MTDANKLLAIRTLMSDYRESIEDAIENDGEVTIGGNGYNCFEAGRPLLYIFDEIAEILDK